MTNHTATREAILHREIDAGDDDAWPDRELLEVHELNELGAGIEPPAPEVKSLSKMTKAELLEEADMRGLDLDDGLKKADILAALEDN